MRSSFARTVLLVVLALFVAGAAARSFPSHTRVGAPIRVLLDVDEDTENLGNSVDEFKEVSPFITPI